MIGRESCDDVIREEFVAGRVTRVIRDVMMQWRVDATRHRRGSYQRYIPCEKPQFSPQFVDEAVAVPLYSQCSV